MAGPADSALAGGEFGGLPTRADRDGDAAPFNNRLRNDRFAYFRPIASSDIPVDGGFVVSFSSIGISSLNAAS